MTRWAPMLVSAGPSTRVVRASLLRSTRWRSTWASADAHWREGAAEGTIHYEVLSVTGTDGTANAATLVVNAGASSQPCGQSGGRGALLL